jgi:ATP-binding cassette, subfamily B, bacterial HlyB/CyaB
VLPLIFWELALAELEILDEKQSAVTTDVSRELNTILWALGSLAGLHRVPFNANLISPTLTPPCGADSLIVAGRALGFRVERMRLSAAELVALPQPAIALTEDSLVIVAKGRDETQGGSGSPNADADRPRGQLLIFPALSQRPLLESIEHFAQRFTGEVLMFAPLTGNATDPDALAAKPKAFGFRWFVPELAKHKAVWRDVLGASLILQLLALATPLFTQAIIDKVVVHRTESTLIAIGVGMAVIMLFTALLSWVRQYLVLHTGNRVDAVLGAAVFEHLFKLPARYFEQRPTGVIAARLHGVETIREFVSSAAVTLVLDVPFLLICVAVMFHYSTVLTLITLGILTIIVAISVVAAPMFQRRLNEQFLLGARNQAFLTEYVAGVETVKSLQMEPMLKSRYSDYTAQYLKSSFATKQIGNTYNTLANTLEQIMTLLVLICGAWLVMSAQPSVDLSSVGGAAPGQVFTIGMLVAFQMFAGKLSQPLLRLVGLWQQFQQASLSVSRLGDIMNTPTEPYSTVPARLSNGPGRIEVRELGFRYSEQYPLLYRGMNLSIEPGEVVALMGPSGCGKSTLAKILQGFYQPTEGQVRIDGVDIRNLSANELRSYFGVVPQETVLFSGSVFENLMQANAHASFTQITQACKMAGIHTVIEALPSGYQTVLGERGVGLSGGQRQRLAIARALLKRPKILIFDEATSALDGETAEAFAKTINQLRGKVAMLFVTHRLPASLKVDRTLCIENAQIREVRLGATRADGQAGVQS